MCKQFEGASSLHRLTARSWSHGLTTRTHEHWETICTQVPLGSDRQSQSDTVRRVTAIECPEEWGSCGPLVFSGREAEVLSGTQNMEAQRGLRKGQHSSPPPVCVHILCLPHLVSFSLSLSLSLSHTYSSLPFWEIKGVICFCEESIMPLHSSWCHYITQWALKYIYIYIK